jgi:toxin ParE1/3/4
MAFRVDIAKSAERQLEELYLWVVDRAPTQGSAWFNGFERAIHSLEQLPKRCRIAPESFDPDLPVRVLTYGRSPHVYRVFFTVEERANIVRVVHVRRGARQKPAPSELKGE